MSQKVCVIFHKSLKGKAAGSPTKKKIRRELSEKCQERQQTHQRWKTTTKKYIYVPYICYTRDRTKLCCRHYVSLRLPYSYIYLVQLFYLWENLNLRLRLCFYKNNCCCAVCRSFCTCFLFVCVGYYVVLDPPSGHTTIVGLLVVLFLVGSLSLFPLLPFLPSIWSSSVTPLLLSLCLPSDNVYVQCCSKKTKGHRVNNSSPEEKKRGSTIRQIKMWLRTWRLPQPTSLHPIHQKKTTTPLLIVMLAHQLDIS